MALNRREVVKLGSGAAVGTLLPGLVFGQNEGFESALSETLARLKAVFAEQGFAETPSLPIASGDPDYNGGLRHDFDQSALPIGQYVIQPLARVGDVAEKHRPDVLPVFHEVGCHPAADADGQMTTRLMMQVLTEGFGLDPSRIAFVSVPQADALRPTLDDLNLPFAEKVLLRDEAEALAARDASGFFFPNPVGTDYLVTMGVYYRVGKTDEPAPAAYPPSADWTEIGEIIIGGDAAPLGISLGAERLTYAVTGQYPTWDQRLDALFTLAEQEGTQPPGLVAFR